MTDPTTALPSFRLDGRVAIVTGASIGIGRTIAGGYAQAGAHVLIVARNEERLEEVRAEIADAGGSVETMRADITRLADICALGDRAAALSRERDAELVLLNNAGYAFTKSALEVTEEDFDLIAATHLKGTFFCCQQVGRTMLERGYGKIVNMGSAWGESTDARKVPYCTVKAGIHHMTRALSTEWAPKGVRVNTLAPTATLTKATEATMERMPERFVALKERVKLGRFPLPEELVGAAIFLASEASDFVTGHTLYVDGGLVAAG